MNLSAPFIRRPIATSLLALALLLAGGAAFTQLSVGPLPKVDLATINVGASLPGASPTTMATSVAMPLERRLARIAGVSELTSTSALGSTSITVQFSLDRDIEGAARDVQAAINAASGDLPANLPSVPNFRKVNPSDSPILILALRSKSLPLPRVFESANTVLAQKISQVPGVGQVGVGGGVQPAVRIRYNPLQIAGMGLSVEDLRNAIAAATADQPKGGIGATQFTSIGVDDQLTDANQWGNIIVRASTSDAAVGGAARLGDIGQVFNDVENERVAGWFDGERAVMVIIRRTPGANILDVIDRVKGLLPELAASIPAGIDIDVAIDRSTTIRASVHDVEKTLLISIILVVLVVLLFLQSGRATSIPGLVVPLALVATFGVMFLLDYSLDNLSLMALTIATGFVVDDAIVVTENVARHIENGVAARRALDGVWQIGFTIVSITSLPIAVFIPLLFMGGVVGRLFREFAMVLTIAIVWSALLSLTLTPMMCSRLLVGRDQHKQPKRIGRVIENALARTVKRYGKMLWWVIHHRAGQDQARDREVDDDAADVDERRDQRRRRARRVGLHLAQQERQHRAHQRAPQHATDEAERDRQADAHEVLACGSFVRTRGAPHHHAHRRDAAEDRAEHDAHLDLAAKHAEPVGDANFAERHRADRRREGLRARVAAARDDDQQERRQRCLVELVLEEAERGRGEHLADQDGQPARAS